LTSLYLSIERSKRQFAVLQIIGIPTLCVMASTMLQGLFIVLAGTGTSFVLCLFGAGLLQKALGSGLNSGEQVCSLGWSQWSLALLIVIICAMIASVIAARRLRISDPAVVARSE
jgi:ABC-type antimicrobial peptide transport system permease subunit